MVQYQHRLYRAVTMFRGALIASIYHKSLSSAYASHDDATTVVSTHEPRKGWTGTDLASQTLMSTDVDSIAECFQGLNEIWARSIEVGIGLWLLQAQLGWSCVSILVLILGVYASNEVSNLD